MWGGFDLGDSLIFFQHSEQRDGSLPSRLCSPHDARKANGDTKRDDGMGMPLLGGGGVERNCGGGTTNLEMSNVADSNKLSQHGCALR